jgi:hypothetical protein
MTRAPFSLRATTVIALQQIALAALLAILTIGWLHIPDANPLEVFASVVLGLLVVTVFGAGESAIALWLTNKAATSRRLLLGTGIVLAASLLWCALSFGLDHMSAKDGLYAGYLNSRFPASLRTIFSYERLITGLAWLRSALRWIAAGVLGSVAFAYVACDLPKQGMMQICRSAWYWASLLMLTFFGSIITGALLGWTPGRGLTIEALSLLFRMLTVILLDASAIALLLQAMANATLSAQSGGTEEPLASQPRTVDIP